MDIIQSAEKSSLVWIPKEVLSEQGIKHLRKRFTFKPRFAHLKPIPTYKETDLVIGFPRNSDIPVDNIMDNTKSGFDTGVRFLGELRDYQQPLEDEFVARINRGQTDIILEADTGAGKTVILIDWWCQLGKSLLVVVPKTDLINQWRTQLLELTTLKADDIGEARQDTCDFMGKKVVIGMLHSLYKDKYLRAFNNYFGCVIFDELHKLGAHFFSGVGSLYPAKYRLGATATLKRADGMEEVFYSHLGRNIIRLTESTQPVPKVALLRYTESSGETPGWATDQRHIRGMLISMLAENKHRTGLICDAIPTLVNSGRQTLVLSERTTHLAYMRNLCINMFSYPEEEVGLYVGKTSQKERDRIAAECKLIFATTNMLSLGTNIPTLRALVFATPIGDIAQAAGRIRRTMPGLKEPIILDVIDTHYPETIRWFNSRARFYRTKGCATTYITGA